MKRIFTFLFILSILIHISCCSVGRFFGMMCDPAYPRYQTVDESLVPEEDYRYKLQLPEYNFSLSIILDAVNFYEERRVGLSMNINNTSTDSIDVYFKNLKILYENNPLKLDRYWLTYEKSERPVFLDSVDFITVYPNQSIELDISAEHFIKKGFPQQLELSMNNVFRVNEQLIKINKTPFMFQFPEER